MPSVSSLEDVSAALAGSARRGPSGADRRRPHGARPGPHPRARSGRPHLHGRGRCPAVRASRGTRGERSAALARSARRPDDRSAPRAERLRPAQAPLRRATRPRPRRDARPGGRDDRERGRQGREERRGLRPRATRVRLRRAPRLHRARQLPAPPAADRRRGRSWSRPTMRRTLRRSFLALSCNRVRSTCSIRVASRCCSKARSAPSAAQVRGRANAGRWRGEGQVRLGRVTPPTRGVEGTCPLRTRFARRRAGSPCGRSNPARSRCRVHSRTNPKCRSVTNRLSRSGGAGREDSTGARPARGARGVIREYTSDCVHCGFCLPDVPDVRALERGDGLAARPHPSHGRAPRRDDRAERDGRPALRPLPRLHGLPVLLPVRACATTV